MTSIERRVLVVDDSLEAREFFSRALQPGEESTDSSEPGLEPEGESENSAFFELDFSEPGSPCLDLLAKSTQSDRTIAVCILNATLDDDFDPVEFTTQLWEVAPELQVILCTETEHQFWSDILRRLKFNPNLMILGKPLMESEVLHAALLLSEKYRSTHQQTEQPQPETEPSSLLQHDANMRAALEAVLLAMRKVKSDWTKIRLDSAQRVIRKLNTETATHASERSSTRLAFCRDVLILVLNPILTKDPFIRVISRDVSQGGMSFLYFKEIFEPRILTFLQVRGRPPIICYGTITRCIRREYGMWEYGVMFDDRVPNGSRKPAVLTGGG